MTDSAVLLETRGISKTYGAVVALRSGDLSVRAGEIHALMGANGAGKSTLVKVLTGDVAPNSGTILLDGKGVRFASPASARQAGLSSVYQDVSLVPLLTIAQNLRLSRIAMPEVRPWIEELELEHVDLNELARDVPTPILHLLDLAQALATLPRLLILDEVTATLPADLTERVFRVARRWRTEGRSVVLISHRMPEVQALCDRATVLRDGTTVGVVDLASSGQEEIVSLMLGEAAASVVVSEGAVADREPAPAVDRRPALEVRNLRSGKLKDVSFTLHRGEVLGLVALEGQGQADLFDCLSGNHSPEGGEIIVQGKPRKFRHPHDAIGAGLVLVPADRALALLPQRSVRENIALPMINSLRNWGLIRLGIERKRVRAAIDRLAIDTRSQSRVKQLSGGNQQKVTLARWLATGFTVLLCFDPTRGIDIRTKEQMYGVLRELAASGSAVLLFTSELPEIQLACDRAIVLFGGAVTAELAAHDATEAVLIRAAHGLVTGGGEVEAAS
ncbi:MAG TPA: sugar ABC transporter ATP-binding protein [Candidatus Acidoferrum sp.]|nr:sugar ABC transporter ATP-binding protein [Candidatus Acidoferrum sp.]